MEFLVIGNGSIGNRHSNNLRELNHNVYSYSYRQRSLLNKNGGSLGETGSASFNFEKIGEIKYDMQKPTKKPIL